MSTFAMRSRAQLLMVAGMFAVGPALAQNVILDCADDGAGCEARIPDGSGVDATASITVPPSADCGGLPARSVKAGAVILHSNVGDLRLVLESPLGAQFTLLSRARETAGAPLGSCAGDNMDAKFADGETTAVTCGELAPAISLRRAPETGMAALVGPIQSGTWLLHVADLAEGGDGKLVNWSLNFTCDSELALFMDSFES